MNRDPSYTRAGVAASVTSAAFSGLMIGVAIKSEVGLPDPKEWQTLIGAAVGICAAYIAWTNVRTTVRANLMSREEDRIERTQPGLRSARGLLSGLLHAMGSEPNYQKVVGAFVANGIGTYHEQEISAAIDRLLPHTDAARRLAIIIQLRVIAASAQVLSSKGGLSAEAMAAQARINEALIDLKDIRSSILALERRYRQQSPRLREQIDKFLWKD